MKELLTQIILSVTFVFVNIRVECVMYDRYFGRKLNNTQIKDYQTRNLTSVCVIDVKPCTPHEGSRLDGTCNNYKYPTRGSAGAPYLRLLPPDYAKNVGIRVAKNGEPLPSARKVRTSIQPTGRVVDKNFNNAALHLAGFVAIDLSTLDGILDYIKQRPHCCQAAGQTDPRCIPITVPEDDPYLKVTDIRCLNFSRAATFQDLGCIPRSLQPEQVNFQTPRIDLSTVYGVNEEGLSSVREGKGGLLRMEKRDGRYVPLGDAGSDVCSQNMPNETICYKFGVPLIGNFDLRLTTFTIFFMREHNRLASKLETLNPCWKDDRLFKVARQINIATLTNLFMYELNPILLGYKNMVNFGLISERVEHLTAYDRDAEINMFAEYVIAARYFHSLIDGRVKKYNKQYRETYDLSISDTLFRPALIEQNTTFEEINRGTFYQKSAGADDIQDPEIAETFYGKLQRASDLPAIDIQRGRDMGVRGYNDYRKFCGRKPATKFDDFLDVMDVSKLDALQKLYRDVDDVDMLAGIMSETFIEGGFVGPTLFCIIVKQLQLFRYGDRFWFERGDHFHSFTLPQLHEIRKTSMARFACDNVEGIEYIQPRALLNVGPGNEPIACEHIPALDLSKWTDLHCEASTKQNQFTTPKGLNSYYQFL